MHERNPYKSGIDFVALAETYPPLNPHLRRTSKGATLIDFKDEEAQKRLTEALLSRDFDIKLTIPGGRLCPPVPNRLNYILWIQDLLAATFAALSGPSLTESPLGVDIGIGASAIYPLLGCRLDPSWRFIGTDVDPVSFAGALVNVTQNGLEDRVRVVSTTSSEPIFKALNDSEEARFSFTMCNPPFYGSVEEVERSAEGKVLEPNGICTGSENEMITPGGEAAFVKQMVEESFAIGARCLWYTSMLGKLSSLGEIVEALRIRKIDNYAVTELTQGQTRRWVVAWTFSDARLPDSISRALPSAHHALLPPPNSLSQAYPTTLSLSRLMVALDATLNSVEGLSISRSGPSNSTEDGAGTTSLQKIITRVSASENTWSRAARRRGRQRAGIPSQLPVPAPLSDSHSATRQRDIVMAVEIRAVEMVSHTVTSARWALECTWLRGKERALFESFWGHVSRKVGVVLVEDGAD